MRKLLTDIKNVFINLPKLGLKKATGVILYLLSFPMKKGVWFIAFYFVFIFKPNEPTTNINIFIVLGVVVSVWFLIIDRMKHKIKSTSKTPLKGVLPRVLFYQRYMLILLIAIIILLLKFEAQPIITYLAICNVSHALGILFEGIKISIFKEEWLDK